MSESNWPTPSPRQPNWPTPQPKPKPFAVRWYDDFFTVGRFLITLVVWAVLVSTASLWDSIDAVWILLSGLAGQATWSALSAWRQGHE